jgi:hypothetical protein
MQNQFDSSAYPDSVPEELTAGSRWAWTRSDITAAYPTASYTLKFRFSLLESPYTDESVTASKADSAHVVEVASADTGYTAGAWSWSAVIVRDSDSEEVTVDTGFVTVKPDLGASPGDTRAWIYQVLTAIRANLLDQASRSQKRIVINGRELESRSYSELVGLEQEFSKRWQAEQRKVDRKAGRASGSRVLVKMSA